MRATRCRLRDVSSIDAVLSFRMCISSSGWNVTANRYHFPKALGAIAIRGFRRMANRWRSQTRASSAQTYGSTTLKSGHARPRDVRWELLYLGVDSRQSQARVSSERPAGNLLGRTLVRPPPRLCSPKGVVHPAPGRRTGSSCCTSDVATSGSTPWMEATYRIPSRHRVSGRTAGVFSPDGRFHCFGCRSDIYNGVNILQTHCRWYVTHWFFFE